MEERLLANFNSIICWLIFQEDDHREPGKIEDLQDGAGLTRFGLTQRWHQKDLPAEFWSTMEFDDAVKYAKLAYKKNYWNLLDGDLINSDQVAAPLLSFAVNDTVHIAVKTLQAVLQVPEDGLIGPKTLEELNQKDPDIVAKLFRAEWISFYQLDVKLNPSKQKFLDGWINRASFPYPSKLVQEGLYGDK